MLFSTSIIFPQKKGSLQIFLRCKFPFVCFAVDSIAGSGIECMLCCMCVNMRVCGCGFLKSGSSWGWWHHGGARQLLPLVLKSRAVQNLHLQLVFTDAGLNSSSKPQCTTHTILSYWGSFFAMNKELWVNPSKQPQIKDRPEQLQGQTGFPKSFFNFRRKKNAKCVNIWWAHHQLRPQTRLCQRSLKAAGEIFPMMFS